MQYINQLLVIRYILPFLLLTTACQVKEVELVGLENFKMESISTEGITIGMDARLNNPNGFAIKVKEINFDIFVRNDFLATTKLVKPVKIKAKSSDTYHFTITDKSGTLNTKILPKLLLSAAGGGKIPIRYKGYIKGKVFMFGKKIPLEGKEDFEW